MAECGSDEASDPLGIPACALLPKTRRVICSLLNPVKVIPTETGVSRDWLGLAELMGISGEQLPLLKQHRNPTEELLRMWTEEEKNDETTIRRLVSFLEELDRFDIIDDTRALIDKDIDMYSSKRLANGSATPIDDSDSHILTHDDIKHIKQGKKLIQYDAFVLFADRDIQFATQIIETMENERKLTFCLKDRDLVVGVDTNRAITDLIAERCNRLLVIFSTSFFESAANKFLLSFAQNIGIDQRIRKIVPVKYTNCDIPVQFKYYHILDYDRAGELWNFWDNLHKAISVVNRPSTNLTRSVSNTVRPTIRLPGEYHCSKSRGVKFNSEVNLSDGLPSVPLSPTTSISNESINTNVRKSSWIKRNKKKLLFWRGKHKVANNA